MSRAGTIGSYVLKGIAVLLLLNVIHASLTLIVTTMSNMIDTTINIIGGGWLLSPFVSFLKSTWSWIALVVTDVIGLAVIVLLAFIEDAFSTKWS